MKQYMLSIIQPDGDVPNGSPPPPDVLEKIMREVNLVQQQMKAEGAWVFSGGLYPPATATVIRFRDGNALMTDGPFVESKEHVGGLSIIQAADLDAALEWGRKLSKATTLPIEVRPFREGHC